jgi:osmotically-inducible protein OsmY
MGGDDTGDAYYGRDRAYDGPTGRYADDGYGAERRESHRGKGPKGYARSDARITEDIADRMADDHDLDASEVSIRVEKQEATLEGSVSDRGQKRRAEDIAYDVSGVKHVQNNLRIV